MEECRSPKPENVPSNPAFYGCWFAAEVSCFRGKERYGTERPTIRATETEVSAGGECHGAAPGAPGKSEYAGRQAVHAGGSSLSGSEKPRVGRGQAGGSKLFRPDLRHFGKRVSGSAPNSGPDA